MDDIRQKVDKAYAKIDKLAMQGKEKTQDYYLLVDDFINKGDYGIFEICLYEYYNCDISQMISLDDVKKKSWPEILFQSTTPFLKRLGKLYKTKNVYQQGYDFHTMEASAAHISLSSPLSSTYSILPDSNPISFTRYNDIVKLNIINDNIYRVSIYESNWNVEGGVDKPQKSEFLQKIEISASFSTYNTEVPTTYGSDYLVISQQRGTVSSSFEVYNYKLSITKNTLLGQVREVETILNSKDYNLSPRLQRLNKNIITSLQVDKIGSTNSIFISQENPELSYDANLLAKYTTAINILLS